MWTILATAKSTCELANAHSINGCRCSGHAEVFGGLFFSGEHESTSGNHLLKAASHPFAYIVTGHRWLSLGGIHLLCACPPRRPRSLSLLNAPESNLFSPASNLFSRQRQEAIRLLLPPVPLVPPMTATIAAAQDRGYIYTPPSSDCRPDPPLFCCECGRCRRPS